MGLPFISAIIPAAGKGKRFGLTKPKLFVNVYGKPVLFYTLKNLSYACHFKEILVAADPFYFKEIEKIIRSLRLRHARVVSGGATRAESVRNAFLQISVQSDWVLIHDAARPLVTRQIVRSTLAAARRCGAAIAAIPVTATVKRTDQGSIIAGTEDRDKLCLAQTPQIFNRKKLLHEYRRLGDKALRLTDEASFFDGTATRVRAAAGALSNLKITTAEDIELFRFYLNHPPKKRV